MASHTRVQNWAAITLREADSFAAALELMNRGGYQLALVRRADGRLAGMVTDSDIRKALLRGITLEQPVAAVMNASPLVVSPQLGEAEAHQLMLLKDFCHLPVVDASGRMTGMISIGDLVKWKIAEAERPAEPTTPTSSGMAPPPPPAGAALRETLPPPPLAGGAAAASFGLTGTRRTGALARSGWGSWDSCSIQGSSGGGGSWSLVSGRTGCPPLARLPPMAPSGVGLAGPRLRNRSTSNRLRSWVRACCIRLEWVRYSTELATLIMQTPPIAVSSRVWRSGRDGAGGAGAGRPRSLRIGVASCSGGGGSTWDATSRSMLVSGSKTRFIICSAFSSQ